MREIRRRDAMRLAFATALAMPSVAGARESWPSQPVRMIVPFSPGGPTDVAARLVADGVSSLLPHRVIVENRTGSGVVVGSEAVAKAPKDGNTFLYSTAAHAVLRPLFPNLGFDPVRDFQPVALVGVIPMLLMVNNAVPASSLQELIALLRAEPGRHNYATSGAGSAAHLATELFLQQAGNLRVNHIPYRGAALAMPDLLNGSLTMFLNVASDGLATVQRGGARGLAISSAHRMRQLPEVPTFAEAGMPAYKAYTWHMVLAPAGTPPEIVQTMNDAVRRVLKDEKVLQRLGDLTVEARSDSTPESAAQWLRAEIAKWEPLARQAGIQAG
jgi:tripartite-type tricarboxylate transporter receptor subunit TctC